MDVDNDDALDIRGDTETHESFSCELHIPGRYTHEEVLQSGNPRMEGPVHAEADGTGESRSRREGGGVSSWSH